MSSFTVFTGGRFFGLVLLFVSASVHSRVRVRLSWFGFVCSHRLMNFGERINRTEATVINISCCFYIAVDFVVVLVRCVLGWFCFVDF